MSTLKYQTHYPFTELHRLTSVRDPRTNRQVPAELTYEGKAFVVGFPDKGKAVIYRPDPKKKYVWAIKEEFGPVGKGFGQSVAISKDASTILVSNQDNDVFAINVSTGKVISFSTPPCRSFGKHVSISGDGKVAAVGTTDLSGQGTVRLYFIDKARAEKNRAAYIGEITGPDVKHATVFAEAFSLDDQGHALAVSSSDKIDSSVLFYRLWHKTLGTWAPMPAPKVKLVTGKDLSIDGKVVGLRHNSNEKVFYVVTRADSEDRQPVFKGADVVEQEDGTFIDQKFLDNKESMNIRQSMTEETRDRLNDVLGRYEPFERRPA